MEGEDSKSAAMFYGSHHLGRMSSMSLPASPGPFLTTRDATASAGATIVEPTRYRRRVKTDRRTEHSAFSVGQNVISVISNEVGNDGGECKIYGLFHMLLVSLSDFVLHL